MKNTGTLFTLRHDGGLNELFVDSAGTGKGLLASRLTYLPL